MKPIATGSSICIVTCLVGTILVLSIKLFESEPKTIMTLTPQPPKDIDFGSGFVEPTKLLEPAPIPPHLYAKNYTDAGGAKNLGGLSQGPGITIVWATETETDIHKATPASVLELVANRISFLQKTTQASTEDAQVLFLLLKAIDLYRKDNQVSSEVPKED
jgi:hypothetical protein